MSNAYEIVTDKILEVMKAGVCPWRRPWKSGKSFNPINAVSKSEYRGLNRVMLAMNPFSDYRWVSYKQAQELGGQVRKGEKSSLAIFWTMLSVSETEKGPKTKASANGEIPLLRFYNVFNVEQCDGLSLDPIPTIDLAEHERIEKADSIVSGMPVKPVITESGNNAYYRPSDDIVQVPKLGQFDSSDHFYSTLFHELGHATGHEKRLNRKEVMSGGIRFGSEDYSKEELVAELCSAFLCQTCHLDNSLIDQSASYLSSWLQALKNDSRLIITAAAQAQKAADFILGKSHFSNRQEVQS